MKSKGMKSFRFVLLLIMGFAQGLSAQTPEFYTCRVKGNVMVVTPNNTARLMPGSALYAGCSLEIHDSMSEVMLLSRENYFVRVSTPGTYAFSELAKYRTSDSTHLSAAYLARVWNPLFLSNLPGQNQFFAFDENRSRGGNAAVLVSPAADEKISGDSTRFEWHPVRGVVNNTLIIYNKQRVPVHQFITRDTFIVIATASLRAGNETTFFWKLRIMPDETMHRFTILSAEELQQKVRELIGQVPANQDRFLYYIQISEVLYKNGFNAEAYEYVLKAKNALTGKEN